MNPGPDISVIVPVYKVEAYLPQCLRSIRKQTFSNIEIILVDDGSPDNCPDICDAAARDDRRVRVIHQKNAGLSAARNAGIAAAVSPWLMFVDSDDAIRPTFCERALAMVRASGADIAVFDFERYDIDGSHGVPGNRSFPAGLYEKEEAIEALACGNIYDYAWNKIYRRQLFVGVRYPEGELWEDMGTTYLLFHAAEKIYLSHDVLYEYNIRKYSLSKYSFYEVTADVLKQREKEFFFFQEHHPKAAKAMEARITGTELDYCMYRCLNRKDQKYCEVRERLLARKTGFRELGWKMWIKTKCLYIPLLFWLITCDRRRRKRKNGRGGTNGGR